MQLLECEDYKIYLKWKIEMEGRRAGYKSELAAAAGCQRSYLSRVLNGGDDLTLEHALGVTRFWLHTELETEYFLDLVSLARAGNLALRQIILRRLKKTREQSKNLSERFNRKDPLQLEQQSTYYSSWHYAAIHMALTIPTLRVPSKIASALGVDTRLVKEILQNLEEMGLADKSGDQWIPGKNSVHLSKESPFLLNHFLNWRVKAISNSQLKRDSNLNYTAIHSLSQSDFLKIQNLLLSILDKTREIVTPSKEEVLVGFNLDWFLLS